MNYTKSTGLLSTSFLITILALWTTGEYYFLPMLECWVLMSVCLASKYGKEIYWEGQAVIHGKRIKPKRKSYNYSKSVLENQLEGVRQGDVKSGLQIPFSLRNQPYDAKRIEEYFNKQKTKKR